MKNMVVNHVIKMSVQIYETITCDPSQYFQFIFVLFFQPCSVKYYTRGNISGGHGVTPPLGLTKFQINFEFPTFSLNSNFPHNLFMCQILIGSIKLPPIVLLSLIILFIFQVYLCVT